MGRAPGTKSTRQRAQDIARVERAIEVVDLANKGYSHKAIASALNVSVGTVHNDIMNTLESLAARRRAIGEYYLDIQLADIDQLFTTAKDRYLRGGLDADKEGKLAATFLSQRSALLGMNKGTESGDTGAKQVTLSWQQNVTINHYEQAPISDDSSAPMIVRPHEYVETVDSMSATVTDHDHAGNP